MVPSRRPQDGTGSECDEARSRVRVLGGLAAPGIRRARPGRRAPRLRLGVGGGVVGQRRVHVRRVGRRAHRDDQDRHRGGADRGAHTHRHRDGRGHARPPLERPAHPRPRRLRSAGGGGLVRAAVEQAAGPHARVHRGDPPRAPTRRPARVRRRVLPTPLPRSRQRRPGQAAEDHDPPVARRDPDLPRRRGTEERHADRGDRRRLAAALLLAVPARGVRRSARQREGRLRDRVARSPWPSPTT